MNGLHGPIKPLVRIIAHGTFHLQNLTILLVYSDKVEMTQIKNVVNVLHFTVAITPVKTINFCVIDNPNGEKP
jgi:hypothetical protein